MKAAFACWDGRIAPVFDVAREILLVEADSGQVVGEAAEQLPDALPVQKALRLAELGVETLVCGAISRPLHETILAYRIRVIPFVAGELGEVVHAWASGGPDWGAFAMPGCSGGRGRRRFRGMPGRVQAESLANGGRKGFLGQGRPGRLPGAGGGRQWVCPKCGQREPLRGGVPWAGRACPGCGTAMVWGSS